MVMVMVEWEMSTKHVFLKKTKEPWAAGQLGRKALVDLLLVSPFEMSLSDKVFLRVYQHKSLPFFHLLPQNVLHFLRGLSHCDRCVHYQCLVVDCQLILSQQRCKNLNVPIQTMAGRGKVSTLPSWLTTASADVDLPPEVLAKVAQSSADVFADVGNKSTRDVRDAVDNKRGTSPRERERERDGGRGGGGDRDRDRDGGRKPRSRSRSRDRGSRDKDRDRDRDRDRGDKDRNRGRSRDDREVGGGGGGGRDDKRREPSPEHSWRPKPGRRSNFDIVGPGGEELPGVGVGALSTGVGLVSFLPSYTIANLPPSDTSSHMCKWAHAYCWIGMFSLYVNLLLLFILPLIRKYMQIVFLHVL